MTRLIPDVSPADHPVEEVGGKAKSLFLLRGLQEKLAASAGRHFKGGINIPRFFVIPAAHESCELDDILKHADDLGCDRFAVRSSSPLESSSESVSGSAPKHTLDGAFETRLDVDRQELFYAIMAVKESAMGFGARYYEKHFGVTPTEDIAVIVQSMVKGDESGLIYSKFPASIDISRVITWDNHDCSGQKHTLMRRDRGKDGAVFTQSIKVIEGEGIDGLEASALCNASYRVEELFGCPVRIEYQVGTNGSGHRTLYLLQARILSEATQTSDITLPELERGRLLVGSHDVNCAADLTLPAVVIYDGYGGTLPREEVAKLDDQYRDGYILICRYLQFYHDDYHTVTPHKKAAVTGSIMGELHDRDLARKSGLLVMQTEDFGVDLQRGRVELETGTLVRLVSDGARGMLYLAD